MSISLTSNMPFCQTIKSSYFIINPIRREATQPLTPFASVILKNKELPTQFNIEPFKLRVRNAFKLCYHSPPILK